MVTILIGIFSIAMLLRTKNLFPALLYQSLPLGVPFAMIFTVDAFQLINVEHEIGFGIMYIVSIQIPTVMFLGIVGLLKKSIDSLVFTVHSSVCLSAIFSFSILSILHTVLFVILAAWLIKKEMTIISDEKEQ